MNDSSQSGSPGEKPCSGESRHGEVADFRLFADSVPHMVWSTRPDGTTDYCNRQFLTYVGKSQQEVQGWNWVDVLHPDDRQRTLDVWTQACCTGTEFRIEYRLFRGSDGEYRWNEGVATPLRNPAGTIVRWFGICTDIHDRKNVEEKYRRFATLTSDYVHYCTRRGSDPYRVQWIDGAISPISGYGIEDILGLGCFIPLVHPDDRQTVSDYLLGLVPGDRKTMEFRIVTRSHGVRWVSEKSWCEAGGAADELHLFGAVTDVTERKQVEEQLKSSEERFRSLMELSPDIVSILDENGVLQYNSPAALAIHGYSDEDMAGINTFDLIHPDDQAHVKEFTAGVLLKAPSRSHTVQYRYRNRDGSYQWMEATASNQLGNPHLKGLIAFSRDISERKRSEELLALAKEAAEAASRAKSEFLANMSHEIRTPITGILGFAELLDGTEITPGQRHYLKNISTSAETLLALVNDVLDLAKIEAGKVVLERREFWVRSLVDEVAGSYGPRAQAKGLAVNIQVSDSVPDRAAGDPLRLKQILLNLVDNAVKFTDRGEVTLSVGAEARQDATVLLSIDVTDTGIGIAAGDLSRIFKPFIQVDASLTRKYGGTGLGLAVCSQLSALMGGEIGVDSREGAGSTFHLRIPLALPAFPAETGDAGESPSSPLWAGESLRVLLVEDNVTVQQFFAEVLKKYAHLVDVARNGAEALRQWSQVDYDIVLMDLQMPVMDGFEAVGRLREAEREQGGHLPVIALTAHARKEDRREVLRQGFDGYLSKPTRIKDLFAEMQRCLGRKATACPTA